MGFTDLFSDLLATAFTTESMHAESPPQPDADEDKPSDEGKEGDEKEEGGDDEAEGGDDTGEGEDGGDDEEEEGEDEEEEEEEPEDPKPKIEEECAQSAGCRPVKHHYDECVERVTSHEEDEGEQKGPKEDCVEEFFHLVHCANQCAAPKLFAQLK